MYLVHAGLRPPRDASAAVDLRSLIRSRLGPDDGAEHVSVHPHARPDPVIGVYLRAGSLVEAEEHAAVLVRLLLSRCPELVGWTPLRAQVPLIAAAFKTSPPSSEAAEPSLD
ncbi:hypothetical protein [Streptomyces lavendulae]|uniref:hypothetical protein n=1 Tax=Streptomyces lavendulae TaxID=1914 RepID=UPI0024A429C6|nr:hypothetical protein [Streptomyces lavendulae]GLX24169.1 hypothetical protein Slala01_78130 [Streptomyces lavendulae subsp. lavendulae]GLX30144.1 hypothetical protein Slala02_59640 [Streptomyces lavendulae subsp. lavendulae]